MGSCTTGLHDNNAQYEYETLDANTGLWNVATIRHDLNENHIFEFKLNGAAKEQWYQLINVCNTIENNYKYSYHDENGDRYYVQFGNLYSHTLPFNVIKLTSTPKEVWQISPKSHICFIHGNLITVRKGCILRHLFDANQWEIVTNTITKFRIYNESRSQFYTSIDKINGKLYIHTSTVFAVYSLIAFKWNFMWKISNINEYGPSVQYFGSVNDEILQQDYDDNDDHIDDFMKFDEDCCPFLDDPEFQYDPNLDAIFRNTTFFRRGHGYGYYYRCRFKLKHGKQHLMNDSDSVEHESHYQRKYIKIKDKWYRFTADGIIYTDNGVLKNLHYPMLLHGYNYHIRDDSVFAFKIDECIVILIMMRNIYYFDVLNNVIIMKDKNLDIAFEKLCDVEYDDENGIVYFLRDDKEEVNVMPLKDLLPFQVFKEEIVNGYVRSIFEDVYDVTVPMDVIELIVTYYPIRKLRV